MIGAVRPPGAAVKAGGPEDLLVQLNCLPSQTSGTSFDVEGKLRVEAAWDSSVHNSQLLDRITQPNDHILLTVLVHVEVDGCGEALVVRKDVKYVRTRSEKNPSCGRPVPLVHAHSSDTHSFHAPSSL